MRRDPHIRDYGDRPPYVPHTKRRFRWPEPYDDEVRMIRERVQENGRGLFVLRGPQPGVKLLVEAYYPEDISDQYAGNMLDPYRLDDLSKGRLVVIKVYDGNEGPLIKPPSEPLNMEHIREIRKFNRAARSHLRRQAPASYRKREIRRRREKREQPVFDRWHEFYEQAKRDTKKFAYQPHVGPARGSNLDYSLLP